MEEKLLLIRSSSTNPRYGAVHSEIPKRCDRNKCDSKHMGGRMESKKSSAKKPTLYNKKSMSCDGLIDSSKLEAENLEFRKDSFNTTIESLQDRLLYATTSSPSILIGSEESAVLVEPFNKCFGELSERRKRIRRHKRSKKHTIGSSDPNLREIRKIRPLTGPPFKPIVSKASFELSRTTALPLKAEATDKTKNGVTNRLDNYQIVNSITDESESEGESSSSDSETKKNIFPDLTRRQWATVSMLVIANLCSTVIFSCIAPFYPDEAKQKGMSNFETGIVFGIFELTMFITAPIFGRYMSYIGSRRMFILGIVTTGITAILFGFLNLIPSGRAFFWASLLIRTAEALGDSAFITSSFAIGAKCFPGRIATVVGLMETFSGLGFTVGPPIGGLLYEIGGFQLPFLVLGFSLLILASFTCLLIDKFEDEGTSGDSGMLKMLRIPAIWMMIYCIALCAVSLSFLDPTLANHLSSFNLSPTYVGLMFLLCGGIYTLTAPVWGYIIDRYKYNYALMLFGSLVTSLSLIAVGPSPILNTQKSLPLIGIALGILGLSSGAMYIPTFQTCLDTVSKHGYDESFRTFGCISGLFESAFSFGSFLGPTLAGISVELIGFEWTSTIIAFSHVIFIIIFGSYAFISRKNSSCTKL